MDIVTKLLSILGRLGIVIAIALAFLFGMATTVYLSLRSPEVRVPEVVGKDRFVAENELSEAGLNFRIRASRPSNQVKPDTVLFQLPHAGEVVKAGQTIAVDVSRAAKEGEASENVSPEPTASPENANANGSSSNNNNENKPKKNKNANANNANNANANNANARNVNGGNADGNSNARNANANRPNANATPKANTNGNTPKVNANGAGAATGNSNRGASSGNTNSNRNNRNTNRKPPSAAPTPHR